ncbi:hypothetical protein B1B05_14335 [Domibacillus enclensis]|uniref:Uncharacterized protein n=1 Tax=Domibacillus enclensis TaxID=1017273 RepID=A0A1N7A629_9BACI|nr:hypothetical protein B1B05_14335 [Domibacillus enclensis]SIR34590.1 hypothetical protein SAMN05443094_10784 [Domibacillus enclensis]
MKELGTKVLDKRKSRMIQIRLSFELFMMVNCLVNALARTQKGRLLQDFAFGGAGGELTFIATLQKWISPSPLIPLESSSCASRPSWGGQATDKT